MIKNKFFVTVLLTAILFSTHSMAGYNCVSDCYEDDGEACLEDGYSCTDTDSGVTYPVAPYNGMSCAGTTCIGITNSGKVVGKIEFNSDQPNTAQVTNYDNSGNVKSTAFVTYDHDITDYEEVGNVDDKRGDFYYDEEGLTQRNTTTYASDGVTPKTKTVNTYENGSSKEQKTTTYKSDGYTVETCANPDHGNCDTSVLEEYTSDDILLKVTSSDNRGGSIVTEYENGIAVSKKEYMEECDPNFPCENGNRVLAEYELDAKGHVTAVWKNVPIREHYEDCWSECMGEWDDEADMCAEEEEEMCEDYDEVIGYNREKYAADGETKLALYDSNGELIEAYQEETPQGAKEVKRIYTVEEAAKLVKPTGNTFRIKYK